MSKRQDNKIIFHGKVAGGKFGFRIISGQQDFYLSLKYAKQLKVGEKWTVTFEREEGG